MRTLIAGFALACMSTGAYADDLLDHSFRQLAGKDQVNLEETYGGKVLLIVNTASKCGNTPQYEGLEALYDEYADEGLAVLGFPSNDFLGQEPGTEEQIKEFCRNTYSIQFPMFEKTTVRGDDAHPFYQRLTQISGEAPTWNFHKYLIGRDGKLIASFNARTQPDSEKLVTAIKAALAAG